MTPASAADRAQARRWRLRAARRLVLHYGLLYAGVAIVWIVTSDIILGRLAVSDAAALWLTFAKGVGFILVTTALLVVFGMRYFRRLEASQERYTRLFENAVEGLTVFRVVRDRDGELTDLEVADINPTQQERTGLQREDVVGSRLSRLDDLDERTRSYLEAVGSAARSGTPAHSELYLEDDDAYELLEAYPVGRDRWALAAADVSDVRRAERALRKQEEGIRRAYVDVLDAVTGGKLILLTDEELASQLGVPLTEPEPLAAPGDIAGARHVVQRTAAEYFPGWADRVDVCTPVGEALVNALRHAGGGTYQLFVHVDRLQVAVRDEGPGIDFRMLPRATLQRGFSTASSLGMGFTIMLQVCERVLLSTEPGRTCVVLEFGGGRTAKEDLDAVAAEAG